MTLNILMLLILTTGAYAQETSPYRAPDILVETKLDHDWSQFLFKKLRVLMKNYDIRDPFKASMPGPILLTDSKAGEFLPEESIIFIQDFASLVGLNIANTQTKAEMTGFNYEVSSFRTDLKSSSQKADGLYVASDIYASDLKLSADKLSFTVVVAAQGKNLPVIKIDVNKVWIEARDPELIKFFATLKLRDDKENFQVDLLEANFEKMASRLLTNPDAVEYGYDELVIPKVSVKIGNKSINFSQEKIKEILRANHSAIKGLFVAKLAHTLKAGTFQSVMTAFQNYRIRKEYWLESSIMQTKIAINRFVVSPGSMNIGAELPSDFCTSKSFKEFDTNCVNHKKTKTAETRLVEKFHKMSVKKIRASMEDEQANLVASVSEDYLNKLLATTYDLGLWDKLLQEAGVELGDNKVVLRLDKKGETGTFMMDVIYKPTTLERIFLGASTIRFPLVMDVSLRIEKKDENPVITIRLVDFDLSDETLLRGKLEHNMISTIEKVPRLKSKVMNTIRNKVVNYRGKDILELPYEELRGLGLEHVTFLSDGNGRLNAYLKLEDLLKDDQK